jgi:hypothetical protein
MPTADHTQAKELDEALKRHGVRYLFMGKLGAILLGFLDTTEDVDIFVDREGKNVLALLVALRNSDFPCPGSRQPPSGPARMLFNCTMVR